jgi:hypothetical protein
MTKRDITSDVGDHLREIALKHDGEWFVLECDTWMLKLPDGGARFFLGAADAAGQLLHGLPPARRAEPVKIARRPEDDLPDMYDDFPF